MELRVTFRARCFDLVKINPTTHTDRGVTSLKSNIPFAWRIAEMPRLMGNHFSGCQHRTKLFRRVEASEVKYTDSVKAQRERHSTNIIALMLHLVVESVMARHRFDVGFCVCWLFIADKNHGFEFRNTRWLGGCAVNGMWFWNRHKH